MNWSRAIAILLWFCVLLGPTGNTFVSDTLLVGKECLACGKNVSILSRSAYVSSGKRGKFYFHNRISPLERKNSYKKQLFVHTNMPWPVICARKQIPHHRIVLNYIFWLITQINWRKETDITLLHCPSAVFARSNLHWWNRHHTILFFSW